MAQVSDATVLNILESRMNSAKVMIPVNGVPKPIGFPEFVYFKCESCRRFVRVDRFQARIAKTGPLEGKRTIYGDCIRCGKEVEASISTEEDRVSLARKSNEIWQRDLERMEGARPPKVQHKVVKEKLTTMAKLKKAKAAAAKTTSVSKKTGKGAEATRSTKAAKTAAASSDRSKKWIIPEGAANGKITLGLIMSGGPHTVEELQKRHDALKKTGTTAQRQVPLTTSDYTWLVKQGEFEHNGKMHQAMVGVNEDGEKVFSVPTIADVLEKGAKAGKVSPKGSFNGVKLSTESTRSTNGTAKTATPKPTKESTKAVKTGKKLKAKK